jgi:recombination protein RecA
MAKAKKEATEQQPSTGKGDEIDDLTAALIRDVNREFGIRVAYNLAEQEAPIVVKRWLDTGSIQLNYAIRNAPGGGYPEGRIIEIAGPPAIGKSHLAFHAAANAQAQGGIVIYIDTENAVPLLKLQQMGINIKKGFVYMDMHATEHVFKAIEDTILKAKSLKKDVPVVVVWDSIAATSPLTELNGEYEDNTVGLQARTISKGMRKITGVIGQNNVTLLCLNQLRDAIGVMHGDPQVTPGGKAVPFHASVRVRLSSGQQVKDAKGNVIGIHVIATIKKNRMAAPFRKCMFDIIFGKGIVEHEYIFDEVRSYCDTTKGVAFEHNGTKLKACISGTSGWKLLQVTDEQTGEVLIEKKFYKSEFDQIMADLQYKPFIDKLIEATYTITTGDKAPEGEGEGEGESPVTDEGGDE